MVLVLDGLACLLSCLLPRTDILFRISFLFSSFSFPSISLFNNDDDDDCKCAIDKGVCIYCIDGPRVLLFTGGREDRKYEEAFDLFKAAGNIGGNFNISSAAAVAVAAMQLFA